jgi:molybdenum cofactor cytidylyltransferase
MITVAGMAAVGKPLTDAIVHRPEIAAALTRLQQGDILTSEAVAALLVHRQGGLKGCPDGAIALLYLNLALDETFGPAETERRLADARRIAALALAGPHPGYRAALIGSAKAADPAREVYSRVAAVVLAAGRSSRLGSGRPKQLLPWQPGGTLAGRTVDIAVQAQAVDEVVVVTGCGAGEVQDALADRPVRCVFNSNWQAGQSSSVAAGLQALAPDVSAAVFLLVDQPAVQPDTIDQVVARHRQTLASVVAPVYSDGQRGNPVLFDRRVFPDLMALQGDTGGRPLIQRNGQHVELVAVDRPLPQGIETLEDYQRMVAGIG